jgi:hypothetical protein
LFQIFHLFFRRILQIFYLDVEYALHVCCKCFIWMLHVFGMAFKCFSGVLQVFQTYVASVSVVSDVYCKCFIWMLQK